MGVRSWLASALAPPGAPEVYPEHRYSFSDWINEAFTYTFHGNGYVLPVTQPPLNGERIGNDFLAYVDRIYKSSAPAFAVVQARVNLFSEARFCFRNLRTHRLFTTSDLALLEMPWPNGDTGELLSRMEQDVSLAGNFYARVERGRLRRMAPHRVGIVLASDAEYASQVHDLNSEIAGYLYYPDGVTDPADAIALNVAEVVHWSPIPDPAAMFRGMSWLTPVVHEIEADQSATTAKQRFFDNAMTPNLVVTLPPEVTSQEQFNKLRDEMDATHGGARNAYKALYLAYGADAKAVGADVKTAGLRDIQGGDETRICAAGRVPPVIVGLSEGLQSATYSNYSQARRQMADGFGRPQWRSACAALSKAIRVPSDAELWINEPDIPFLRDDAKEAAETTTANIAAVVAGVNGGFVAASVIDAVNSQDLTVLEHTGLVSVQLQPPGLTSPQSADPNTPADSPAVPPA